MATARKFILLTSLAAALLNLLLWLAVMWYVPRDSTVLILHYNIYLGPDVFGHWYQLLLLPGIGLLVVGLNVLAGLWLLRRELFLGKLIVATSLPAQVVLGSALALILSINRLI